MTGLKYLKQINHRDILNLGDYKGELSPVWASKWLLFGGFTDR